MDEMVDNAVCAIPGCRQDARAPANGVADHICDHHLSFAKPQMRHRLETTARRLAAIEAMWADDVAYERIVASDRYLKLSHAHCCAQESVEAAWTRAKLSIMSAAANGGANSSAVTDQGLRAAG